MKYEIRSVDDDLIIDFLRAVPGVAGLPTWEPEPAAWWAGPGIGPKFGGRPSDEDIEKMASTWSDLDRARVAIVNGKVVGASQMLSLEVTIPGEGPVAMGGLTATGVAATHRRRGLLSAMMRSLFEDARERGEMLSTLCASEGAIYGRYGFGPATFRVRWELDRHRAALAQPSRSTGQMELVESHTATVALAGLHEQIRQTRIGEVSANPEFFNSLTGSSEQGNDGSGVPLFVLHYDSTGDVDGGAVYRTPWSPDPDTSGYVQVDWLEATSSDAYTDLWVLLGDIDLTKRVVAANRPVDETLRWQLFDQRSLRITRHSDNLWVRLIDVPGALATRSYQVEGSLIFEVIDDEYCPWNQGRWHLEVGPEGATCQRTNSEPDLLLNIATLGSIYLGGVSLGPLAKAGLIHELVPEALTRATAMLTGNQAPHNACGF